MTYRSLQIALVGIFLTTAVGAQEITEVPVETFELANGMNVLLVRRPELTTVSAGWVAHVGSANERPGITGMSHFFEHMMFKGSETIGTTNLAEDKRIIEEQEELQEQIREIYRSQRTRHRLGEIDDPFSADARPPELVELERRFSELVEQQRTVMVKDEFDKIYTEAGASGMNAFTSNDITVYFITVPANKLELWFWMESERLFRPVFREFYSERDVVYEERRLRTESTPTGKFDELFDAMFWESHPYSWPVVGWPSDLEVYTLTQAKDYFATYYAPGNLTAALVGNFELDEAKDLAERYFGRLPKALRAPPDVVTLEMPQLAEKRMAATCDCQPQIEIRYHTVPFRHKDSYALDVLAGLLNGRSGRLYKALVLDQGIASEAGSFQDSRKWAGSFSLSAETKGDTTPEDLERALEEEIRKIRDEPIPPRELQKVKNQITASSYRRLANGFYLLLQLLIYDGMGDWEYINEWASNTLTVTADDVQRVTSTYFDPSNRAVARYSRTEGTAPEAIPTELEGLPTEVQRQVMGQLGQIRMVDDVNVLKGMLDELPARQETAPPTFQRIFPLIEKTIQERIAALESGGSQ